MITLYTNATSPNGQKIRLMLAEAAIPHAEVAVDIHAEGEARAAYLRISPTGAVPALTDTAGGVELFESGAILLYLAERSGRFLPVAAPDRAPVFQWLLFEAATLWPVLENIYHLMYAGDDDDAALRRQQDRLRDVTAVIERRLGDAEYIAGECSIADFALYPWLTMLEDFGDIAPAAVPNIGRWVGAMQARPGVRQVLGL